MMKGASTCEGELNRDQLTPAEVAINGKLLPSPEHRIYE
jgi:hypothetical protein